MTAAHGAPSRLERALAAYLEFRCGTEPQAAFLARHADLRDLLEAMLSEPETPDPGPARPEVLGDFELRRETGRGGMGVVYEARQLSLDRRVALKVLPPHVTLRPSTVARFKREAAILAGLDHPNIVRVLAVGQDGGTHWFAMEFVEGTALDRELAAGAPRHTLDWQRRAAGIAAQVADALEHAHRAGVVHRDVKPANILLRQDGTPVLTDFGIARDDEVPSLTLPEGRPGTPFYMSPEQAAGGRIDHRTDVFSLGVTLYELLTGRRPFAGDSTEVVLRCLREVDAPDPRRFNPALPVDLAAVVLRALEKEPHRRYATARDLADDLRAWLALRPVQARPASTWWRLRRWARREPLRVALWAASLALVATLAVGLVATVTLWRTAVDQEHRASALLGEWERLADRRRLDQLVAEADTQLWPPEPPKVAAMTSWLERAQELLQRRPDHAAALLRMDRGMDPREAPEDFAFRRQQLAELVTQLDALAAADPSGATVASVAHRKQQAESVHRLTLEAPAAAWTAACARLAARADHGGLHLVPQLGLVPLGPDPRSGLEEFADPGSGSVPARGADGTLVRGEDTAVVFVLLPGGEFLMGAQKTDPRGPRYDPAAGFLESPPHRVQLDPFFLSKYELTHGQWRTVAGRSAEAWQPGRVVRGVRTDWRHPVANVSWQECATLCGHRGWVLPTEAQWEYACRAGTDTPWWTGAEASSLLGAANLADAASADEYQADWLFHPGTDDGHAVPAPVGTYRPNGFGLFDLHGNVREWCQDQVLRYDLPVARGTGERLVDPTKELRHGERPGFRVHRGGSCAVMAPEHRSSQRSADQEGTRLPALGMRPARALRR